MSNGRIFCNCLSNVGHKCVVDYLKNPTAKYTAKLDVLTFSMSVLFPFLTTLCSHRESGNNLLLFCHVYMHVAFLLIGLVFYV